MDKVFNSRVYFDDGFNCAQSVLSSFSDDLGLDKQTSLKLTTGFGGGFANRGEICGAVVGAFLVFGLKFGIDNSNDKQNREKTYQIIDGFEKEFVKNYGSIKCNELLNIDMSNKKERINAKKNGVFETKCPIFVQKATEIVDKLIKISKK